MEQQSKRKRPERGCGEPADGVRRSRSAVRVAALCFASIGWLVTGACERPAAGRGGDRGAEQAAPDARVAANAVRRFEFHYEIRFHPTATELPLDLFVPVARSDERQTIVDLRIETAIPGQFGVEPVYGNRFWHARVEPQGEPIAISFVYTIERRPEPRPDLGSARAGLSDSDRVRLARFLGPNARVPVDAPFLDPIDAEIQRLARSPAPAHVARAIYDWVVANIEYKKVGTGWGNGDSHWACNERYGNCTDFRSLFISLARRHGIPARFQIGFPVPEDSADGDIAGYHCWLEFYLPERGWVPVDASDASKHPERKELLFGGQPADRLQFTTGRDLRLSPAQRGAPLNFFVYPYVEAAGAPWRGSLETRFHYRALADGAPEPIAQSE